MRRSRVECNIIHIRGGSGCVITFLAQMLKDSNSSCYFLATDISKDATRAILSTSKQNKVEVDVVHSDLLSSLESRLTGQIDILLFNPPYVPSTSEELKESQRRNLHGDGIDLAWAGGEAGREIIDKFLPLIPCFVEDQKLLSPGGKCLMIALSENNPKELLNSPLLASLNGKVVLHRRNASEYLFVLQFSRPLE